MGKIKKILETELVGGTQSTDVYPVTSTKAVYDENNVRLDTILKPATKEAAGLMSPEDKKNIDDKLSKSEGGEVNKPIVITNKDSDYSTTINPDSIYIWSKKDKKNILSVQIDKSRNIIDINSPDGNPINIDNILNLIGKGRTCNSNIYSAYDDTFSASKFKLRTGTNNQVLLGDGTTTSKVVSYISTHSQSDAYIVNILNIDGAHDSFTILGATKELAGLMTAADKTKLDNIESTYISSQNGNVYTDYDSDNGAVTLDISGDYDIEDSGGRIRLKRTEDGRGKMSIMIDGMESSVNAERFNSIVNPNKNEVWSTDGGRINILTLLSNAAIYVAGGFELAGSGIDNTTVVDSPNSIIYDDITERFLARKGSICYTHWKADISKNIAPPSRYGIETDNGVFPFNNQMYKFSVYDDIFIATCSNGTCNMRKY